MVDIRTRGDELSYDIKVLVARSPRQRSFALRVHCVDVSTCATEYLDHGGVRVLCR